MSEPRTRTFLDSGVLITAARSKDADQQTALSVLRDARRVFLTTPFVALEVIPKATFNRQELERSFYARYLESATNYRELNRMAGLAGEEAARCGLAALDALHVAGAFLLKAHELITTEKPGKPIYRTNLVKVRWLYAL